MATSQFSFIEEHFWALVNKSQVKEAETFLESFREDTNPTCQRMCGHLRGQMHLENGDADRAIQIFETTLQNHGSHIRLVCDLACGLYMKDQKTKWRFVKQKLEQLLQLHDERLCMDTKYRVLLCLAKFDEEEGKVGEAMQKLNALLTLLDPTQEASKSVRVMAQLLRIRSASGTAVGLGAIYRSVLELQQKETSFTSYVDAQHALILAEYCLCNSEIALARMKKLFELPKCTEADKALVFYDLLDLALIRVSEDSEWSAFKAFATAWTHRPPPTEILEEKLWCIFEILEAQTDNFPLQQLQQDLTEMTVASQIRILSIIAARFPNTQSSIQRNFNLLLDSLSQTSQRYWRQRGGFETQEIAKIKLHLIGTKLTWNTKQIDLEAKPSLIRFISHCLSFREALTAGQKIPIENFQTAGSKHQIGLTESDHDRLRMTVFHLNKIVKTKWETGPILKWKKDGVYLLVDLILYRPT